MDRFIVVIFTTLCISLTILLLKPPTSQDGVLLHGLPRKLKLSEKVEGHGSQEFRFHKAQTKDHSGNESNDLHKGATWVDGMKSNGGGTPRVFTMDYTLVHRRRPIHNKALPSGR